MLRGVVLWRGGKEGICWVGWGRFVSYEGDVGGGGRGGVRYGI